MGWGERVAADNPLRTLERSRIELTPGYDRVSRFDFIAIRAHFIARDNNNNGDSAIAPKEAFKNILDGSLILTAKFAHVPANFVSVIAGTISESAEMTSSSCTRAILSASFFGLRDSRTNRANIALTFYSRRSRDEELRAIFRLTYKLPTRSARPGGERNGKRPSILSVPGLTLKFHFAMTSGYIGRVSTAQ